MEHTMKIAISLEINSTNMLIIRGNFCEFHWLRVSKTTAALSGCFECSIAQQHALELMKVSSI